MKASNDPFFNAARNAAATRTYRLAVRLGLSREDREDLEQDLIVDMLEHSGKFDPSRSSAATFTGVLSQHRAAELLINRSADRCRLEFGLGAPASNDPEFGPRLDMDSINLTPVWADDADLFEHSNTLHDLEMAIAHMTEDQADLMQLLGVHQDIPSAVKASGMSSATFYRRLDDLKMHLRMFGFKSSA